MNSSPYACRASIYQLSYFHSPFPYIFWFASIFFKQYILMMFFPSANSSQIRPISLSTQFYVLSVCVCLSVSLKEKLQKKKKKKTKIKTN